MKYFGEYLIEKNIITEEQLVIALIEQMKLSAPIPVIANNLHLFTNTEFLKIFKWQTEKGVDFIQACKELNMWTSDRHNTVFSHITKNRPPIGQIIVNLGFSDLETLTKSLDDFLSRLEKVAEPIANSPVTPVVQTTQLAEVVQEAKAQEKENLIQPTQNNLTQKSAAGIDISFAEELKDQMKEFCKQEILDLLQAFESTLDEAAAAELITKLHLLKGTAKLASAVKLSEFLNRIEACIQHLKVKTKSENFSAAISLLAQAVESSFYMKNQIIKSLSEEILKSDPILLSLTNKTTQDLDTILKI